MINSYKKNNKNKLYKKKLFIPIFIVTQLSIISFSLIQGGNLYKKGVLSYWSDDLKKKTSEFKNNFVSYFSKDIPFYQIKLDFLSMRELQRAKLDAIKNKNIGNFGNSKFVKGL